MEGLSAVPFLGSEFEEVVAISSYASYPSEVLSLADGNSNIWRGKAKTGNHWHSFLKSL